MELQEIEVIINPNGQVSMHLSGVKGESCLAITRQLEESLGGKILQRDKTAEFYETAQDPNSLQQWQFGR